MQELRICVNTQTPLVQFLPGSPVTGPPVPNPSVELATLVEGKDYRFSPGGVTRMVYPLVRRLLADRSLSEAHWVSLNPVGPPTVRADRLTLHHVAIGAERMNGYGKVKEALWGAVHGTAEDPGAAGTVVWSDDFSEYTFYNRRCAEAVRGLDRTVDFDAFYIHDFQQLPMGHMLDTLKPKVFRWHIPFDGASIPAEWASLLSTYFNSYDIVLMSSGRYLEELRALGYTGAARTVYPYVDPAEYVTPPRREVAAVAKRYGVKPSERVALVVARMDPMKGQDRALRAFASIARRHKELKLVLVGNGSFSSSAQGVGLSKSATWRAHLEQLSGRLGVSSRVVLTGHTSQSDLDALYARAAFTLLPSIREGFGLVVVESWLHGRAPIVTSSAGVSELVEDGRNGLVYAPDDVPALAAAMERLLRDPELARAMGRRGKTTAKKCSLAAGVAAESAVLSTLVEG